MSKATDLDTLSALLKQIDEAANKGILGGAAKDLKALNKYKSTFKSLVDGIGKAFENGFEDQAFALMEMQEKVTDSVAEYSAKINKCIQHLQTSLTDAERDSAEERLKSLRKEFSERLKFQTEIAQKEIADNQKILDEYKKKKIDLQKVLNEQFVELKIGDTFESLVGKIGGAFTDGGSTISGAVEKSFKGVGALLASAAVSAKMKAKESGDGEGLGNALGGVSKAMMAIGVAVGAAFALFKAFQAIEEAGKKINKSLIDNVGATDLMTSSTEDLYTQVNKVRKDLTKADMALSLGLTSDEVISLVKELSSANFNLREMGENTDNLYNLMKTVRGASVMLGISTSDAAGYMERFRMELGQTVTNQIVLGRMANEFAQIRDLALQSGYSTSNFFSKIKDLTDGIGQFNVRTAQTGKILLSLGKVLGPKAADEFTKGLIGAFGNEGYVDRIKRLMTTNKGDVNRALENSAKSQAAEFGKRFLQEGTASADILKKYGITKENIASKTAGMTDAQIRELLGALQTSGDTGAEAASRQLLNLLDITRAKGMMGKTRALAQSDAGATLAIESSRVSSILGGKSIREADLGQLKLLETLGYSQEKIEQYSKIIELKTAEFESLKTKGLLSEEEQKKYGVRKEGDQFFNIETGEAITDIQDYLQAQGAILEEQFGDLKAPTMESLLGDSIRATQTSSDKISAHLGEILQSIYDVVMGIYDKIFGEQSKEDAAAQAGALTVLSDRYRKYSDEIIKINDEVRKKEQDFASETDVERKKQLREEINGLKKRSEQLSLSKEITQGALSDLRRNKYSDVGTGDAAQARALASGAAEYGFKEGDTGINKLLTSGLVTDKNKLNLEIVAKKMGYATGQELISAYEDADKNEEKDPTRRLIREALEKVGIEITGSMDGVNATMDKVAGHVEDVTEVGQKRYRGMGFVSKDTNQLLVSAEGSLVSTGVENAYGQVVAGNIKKVENTPLEVNPMDPMDPLVVRDRKLSAEAAVEAQTKDNAFKKTQQENVTKGVEEAQKRAYLSQLRGKLSAVEGGFDTTGTLEQIRTRFEADKARFGDRAVDISEMFATASDAGYMDDGFISQSGKSFRISSRDNILAFKDGGPGDPRRSGGGGNVAHITFNVNGADPNIVPKIESMLVGALKKYKVMTEN